MRTIINKLDYSRIQQCINEAKQFKSISVVEANSLMNELKLGKLVEPEEIPNNVVTMHSIVTIVFMDSNKRVEFQLVYPDKADVKNNKISIFSPIATALIGYQIGDEIEWCVPAGMTKIKIESIAYQPEAAGHFNL
ncbi:nucleoside diphosphate kinase regulator [Cytophaga hutchinsonii]|jgi:regulator of nucleoside diphosphate kinase|nr:nucleoside diphosphate kinase regulator [Cytophaga hutchinsonii]SFY00167.1 regulator of nucleoside diphosphate kinase [Cytophaga hutchinsonii ATCC 33406]